MKFVILTMLASACILSAGKKERPDSEAGNDHVDIYATPLLERDQIRAALGAEMPDGVIAIKVKVVPKGDKALSVSRDDFEIISHKNGERSGAFGPTEIAGSSTMVIRQVPMDIGLYGGDPNGPVWGGIPGTTGRPRQAPSGGGALGSGTAGVTGAEAKTETDPKKKDNPLLAILAAKMLPDKETKDAISGLLYFPLEGKQKLKDIDLIYKGPAGRLVVSFVW